MSRTEVTIRHEEGRVLLIINGKGVSIPWKHADEIARGLKAKARQAEEYAKANKIIHDGALALRVGVPIGFSADPKIRDRIELEAAHNRELRRALPGGVKSQTHFYPPSVTRGMARPKPQVISPGGIASVEKMGKLGG